MSERNSIFSLDEFKPYEPLWAKRTTELRRRGSYYDGSIYSGFRESVKRLGSVALGLYRGIKPLYLPLARAVDVDAGIIPGGWLLAESATDDQREAKQTIFAMSDWGTDGVLFVHYGAKYGNVGLKVSDLRDMQKVVVKPVDPLRFMFAEPEMVIYVEKRHGLNGDYEYAEVTTPSNVRTYRNGALEGFEDNEPEFANQLGFVPYVEARHIETGEALGDATYLKAIPMLDEVNQLASYLADIIGKHAEPQWAVMGAEPSDLTKSGDNVWFIPSGGDARALVAPLDVRGVLEFVREIAGNVKESLPELAFDEIKEKTQIATATLEIQLMELVLKIKRTRPNYDHALAMALRMAGAAGADMGLRDLAVLNDADLVLDGTRPILPLDPLTEIELQLQQLALDRELALGAGAEGMFDEADNA